MKRYKRLNKIQLEFCSGALAFLTTAKEVRKFLRYERIC